jgi:hypothetical protein
VLAERGREGCESLLKYEENEKDEVVGSVKGKGIFTGPLELPHALFVLWSWSPHATIKISVAEELRLREIKCLKLNNHSRRQTQKHAEARCC